jgi:hypothetical protein
MPEYAGTPWCEGIPWWSPRPLSNSPHKPEGTAPECQIPRLTVSDMNEPLIQYDVTVTADRNGGRLPDPAESAIGAQQAASSRGASIMSAHTAEQIISIVTVETADRSAAVAVALAVVSEALRGPASSPSR